jgi:hypothetical protein
LEVEMKNVLWIGLGVLIVVAIVLVGLVGGWALWGRHVWLTGPQVAPMVGMGVTDDCGGGGYGMGRGMMGGGGVAGAPCGGSVYGSGMVGEWPSGSTSTLTIDDAHEAVEAYVASLGHPELKVAEVMEFEYNYYAIVEEADTEIGAMELLIDKWSGAVGPEMGPNMMWNTRYGMHGRGGMMGWSDSGTNTISPEEAVEIAQRWLDTYRSGVTVEDHAVPFYGYYTIHTLEDAEIEGMLSVHGTTGQVWYHTWHGAFVQAIDGEADSH